MEPNKLKSYAIRGVAAFGGIGLLALLLPAIWFAFLSTAGLLGIGILGLIGAAIIKLVPLGTQKLENAILKAEIAEAEQNPIEQMWRRIEQRGVQLQETEKALAMIGGQIGGLERMIKDQKRADPEYDASDEEGSLNDMQAYYTALKGDFADAVRALTDMKKEFERKKFKWGFANAADTAMSAMSMEDAKSRREEMLKDVAFQAVENRYTQAFAKLDLQTTKLNANKQLSFGTKNVIDISAINIPTAQLEGVVRK